MSKKVKIIDCDIVYLSYDEPNAEKNYADLLKHVPWAKRVHGVDGSDSAHKACARLSETDRVIVVDGDNTIRPEFLKQEIEFKDEVDLSKSVISWGARNTINGLIYGNGGIKCWPTQLVLDMKTHENAESENAKTQVDFCWDINYIQMDSCMSDVHNNATPQQAWRAGFREGVKMGLLEGTKADPAQFSKQVHWKNFHRLLVWMHVGLDVPNGVWAIYGARQGCYMTNCTDWDYLNVRDFKWLNNFWETDESQIPTDMLRYEIMGIGETLKHELNINVDDPFNSNQSMLFKTLYTNPPRMPNNFIVGK
jgi:hypothetical protein